jgi:hypothetical protein
MAFLHNIRTVARYEAKTLRRSWFFRLFSFGALFIFTILNIGFFSPIGDENWELVSIPSSVPLINLYLLNIGQAIVVIFLAADFLKRDKKLDTNEVLYTRSMSNFEYIIGKTWGILRLFLGLNIIVLSIGLLMNIISKSMSVDFMSYISYLLIISVPTIVFSLGLAFVLMSLIRNQAITFLLLLGIAALDIFYLWFRMGSIFDYMAFGIPVFKSGILGFDNLGFIINQRALYFFLGMAMVLATVLLFKRLPQSKIHRIITIVFLIVFLGGAGICGFRTYSLYRNRIEFKNLVISTNRKFENRNFASVTGVSINFTHKGKSFEASAYLKIINDNKVPLDHYLFSLNPALNILSVTSNRQNLKFEKTNQIVEIDPGRVLDPGQTDSLLISYSGTINESFCYPNYNDKIKNTPYRIALMNVNKRQAFLEEKYVLLTPEAHWYPVAGLNYYPGNPATIKIDFSKYTLRVKNENGLFPVSQGRMRTDNGYTLYSPENPLIGLTLIIGNYLSDTLRVDSVTYITYHFPGHDYYKKDLSELKDTLPNLVSGIMRDLETSFSTRYPFKTLSLVEVPVQFYSYPKENTQTRGEVQPSMVLLPEKLSTIENAGFNKRFIRQKKRMAGNNQVITDKELQVRLFNECIRNVFISGENYRFINGVLSNEPLRYRLGPSFYFFKNNFYSADYPVINAVFESHLQHLTHQDEGGDGFREGLGVLSDNDKANLILKNTSFRDLLAKNPSGDTIRIVLTIKGDWLFNLLRSKAGLNEFKPWFSEYIDNNCFRKIDIQKFNDDFKARFGFDFYPSLNAWFNSKEQPGFLFTDLKATELIIGDRSRYQVTFIASNPEPVAGLFNVSFRTAGPTGKGLLAQKIQLENVQIQSNGGNKYAMDLRGRGMDADDISKIAFIGPQEAKKIGIILDAEPRTLMINTLFAKNIPGEIDLPVNEIIKAKGDIKEFSGEEVLASIPPYSDPSEIIVDNEDQGFISSKVNTISPLKNLFGIKNKNKNSYMHISDWNTPEYWQPVVLTSYFGKYIRSAVYTRGGTGDKKITWTTIINEPGYYEIFSYVGKTTDRMTIKTGGNQETSGDQDEDNGKDNKFKDMHYKVYSDQGVDDITLDYEHAEGGWNNLGRFYLSADTAKVELTNKSAGRIVIGDAIKWVKQN